MAELTAQTIEWQQAGGVGALTLHRPPLNILNLDMLRELEVALGNASRITDLRVLVLRAGGRLFSAGADVADHKPGRVGEMIPLIDRICAALAAFPAPTLAVVQGHALGGGCELALSCDLVVASENATFGQPEIKLATFAPVASALLPGLIGYRRAAELLFSGESIKAAEAERVGMINRAVPAEQLEAVAQEFITKLSALSASALKAAKKAARAGNTGWGSLPSIERIYLEELMSTADVHEGLSAFEEKRAPRWTNT